MNNYYFFIGTEAELIKMAVVFDLFQKKKIKFSVIASGQNTINKSVILEYLNRKVDINLSDRLPVQTPLGVFLWFLSTLIFGFVVLKKEFRNIDRKKTWFIIHGDTLTTVLGAFFGKLFGLKLAHIEAGYRSPSLFKPFPEEIDRTIASALSDVLMCPMKSIGPVVPRVKNKIVVNTVWNTSIDSMHLALKIKRTPKILESLRKKKYFIFAIHRQETLIDKAKFKTLIQFLLDIETNLYCIFTMHEPTKKLLHDLGLLDKIKRKENIYVVNRLQYFDYIHVLKRAEFIMTDGVGNQQETFYMGKPCLILRDLTEGKEGVNKNAYLSENKQEKFLYFLNNYCRYQNPPIKYSTIPSKIITNYLLDN